ncbi:glycosyltransferase family 2 protein [Kineococcus sp. SYSU DK018]|uniref:glycosyltransferase n=1 Tax=Kineococcus sp. SYSU DK018 TaxID=3383139 RepID=UPI003D7EE2BA
MSPTPGAQTPGAAYVVPLRWDGRPDAEVRELGAYLASLRDLVDVTVVDGSPPAEFERHAAAWRGSGARHVPPRPWPGRNGKVAGVVTGVLGARHELVVVADDDVRYSPAGLRAVLDLLAGADAVRPQNVFSPAPWHARWDTARSLVNRAFGADYPGTIAVRRSTFEAMGGYDGDVLFENLQMLRTVAAAGGRVVAASGVYVPRLPPTARHFAGQRVRQAYDDFAQPWRLAVEASWLPLLVLAARRGRGAAALAGGALTAVAVAEAGRRRHGGRAHYPATAALWAPLWAAERAVCVWAAIGARARGGVRYAGSRVPHAAKPVAPAGRADRARVSGAGPGSSARPGTGG